ncbi:MAG: BMP family protein [Alphaproteobacteria bacterium]
MKPLPTIRKAALSFQMTLLVIAGFVTAFYLGSGVSKASHAQSREFRPAIVYFGYKYDGAFLENSFLGVQKFEQETGIKPIEVGITEDQDYQAAIQSALDQGANMIIAIGFNWADSILEMANQYTLTRFAIIDAHWLERFNIAQYSFKENEGSYLAGIYAGMTTKTNRIGFLGGVDIPLIRKYSCGFLGGIKSVNPDATLVNRMVDEDVKGFNNPAKAYLEARNLINQGVDIIYHAAGGSGDGIINAAKEDNIMVIGSGADQSSLSSNVVATMLKQADVAILKSLKDGLGGKFLGSVSYLGVNEGAINLILSPDATHPTEVVDAVKRARQDILGGTLMVHRYDQTNNCPY